MDGFYLAFIAVGAGLFWQSARERDPLSNVLMFGWISLGASLASAVVLLSVAAADRPTTGAVSSTAVFEALRHILLGGSVVCVGFSFGKPAAIRRPLPNAEADARAKALETIGAAGQSEA